MDDPKNYLDLPELIEVPWDELRSERNLRAILEAGSQSTRELPGGGSQGATVVRARWPIALAAAALIVASAGVTALAFSIAGTKVDPKGEAHLASAAQSNAAQGASGEVATRDEAQGDGTSKAQRAHADTEFAAVGPSDLGPARSDDAASLLAFADGAQARLAANARVRVLSDTQREFRLGQEQGDVDYAVSPALGESREVVVEVAHLFIMVQDSHFSAVLSESKVSIEVESGVIIVDDGEQQLELREGDSLRLRRQAPTQEAEALARTRKLRATSPRPARSGRPIHAQKDSHATTSAADIEVLMERADAARHDGDLALSASTLEQLLSGEGRSSAPPVAWMTLGRVERRRGNHEAAARAFESYFSRHARRPLAEDALHEAFVSWRAAGQAHEAKRVAQDYLEAFPAGLHAEQMATSLP